MLYEGLISPESIYSSESSNRSTAQVQLVSEKTGYILFIQFIQEFLKEWVESVLFDPELEKHGFEKGSAYITFQTDDADLDTNYLVASENHTVDIERESNVEGSTALTTDDEPYEKYNRQEDNK